MDYVYYIIHQDHKIDRDVFAITFDDGYFHNYEECFPLIKRFKIPAMIYLASNHIDTNKFFWWDRLRLIIENTDFERIDLFGEQFDISTRESRKSSFRAVASRMKKMRFKDRDNTIENLAERYRSRNNKKSDAEYRTLNWQNVKEMQKSSIEFGSHTINHANLPYESEACIINELVNSKSKLEKEIGKEISHFAYPNGDVDEKCVALVKKAGYKTAVTMRYGFNNHKADLLNIKRIGINSGDTIYDFVAKISGLGLRNFVDNLRYQVKN